MTRSDLSIALDRFGLGARRGEPMPADPRADLAAQAGRYVARPAPVAGLPDRESLMTRLADYIGEIRGSAGRQDGRAAGRNVGASLMEPIRPARPAMAESDENPALAGLPAPVQRFVRESRAIYQDMVTARVEAALASPAPFIERMVHFWANHFAVSIDKLTVTAIGGLLEFEAIRPNVLGSFADMLLAVERHPAMLLYLDQAQSIGPGSRAASFGRRRGGAERGLNENLAREILELHTLGVDGGYTQADVSELARALTGWTVGGLARRRAARFLGDSGRPGSFLYAGILHEPGERRILGRTYGEEGEGQGRAALLALAAHPATARHIAAKLARHFAGDDPPAALVERLRAAFAGSGGDLPTVYRALIESPEPWAAERAKFRSPWDWSVAALRAVGLSELPGQAAAGLLGQLGQPVWRPGSPAGYDDLDATWAGPDALVRRAQVAERLADRIGGAIDARALAGQILPDIGPATRAAIERAESPGQGLALLLLSPEFLRR